MEAVPLDDLPVGSAPRPSLQLIDDPAARGETGEPASEGRRLSNRSVDRWMSYRSPVSLSNRILVHAENARKPSTDETRMPRGRRPAVRLRPATSVQEVGSLHLDVGPQDRRRHSRVNLQDSRDSSIQRRTPCWRMPYLQRLAARAG